MDSPRGMAVRGGQANPEPRRPPCPRHFRPPTPGKPERGSGLTRAPRCALSSAVILALLSLSPQADGTVQWDDYTGTVVAQGGGSFTVRWEDHTEDERLASFGPSSLLPRASSFFPLQRLTDTPLPLCSPQLDQIAVDAARYVVKYRKDTTGGPRTFYRGVCRDDRKRFSADLSIFGEEGRTMGSFLTRAEAAREW